MRGYWGIVLYEPKNMLNVGGIVRSARCFGSSFIVTVGQRYKRTAEDTQNVFEHFPGFHFATLDEALKALPINAVRVRVEVNGDLLMPAFKHPRCAAYIFGGEDRSVPEITGAVNVRIPTTQCLNLAVASSIVMYDRYRQDS